MPLTRTRDYPVLTTGQEADKKTNCAVNLLEFPFRTVSEEKVDGAIHPDESTTCLDSSGRKGRKIDY